MSKYKVLTITILVIITVAAFVVKSGLLKRDEVITESSDPSVPIEENNEISNDNKVLTIDLVLKVIGSIVKWEGNQYSRATILWNTEEEELKLEGIGYIMGDLIGSTDLKEKHGEIKIYLRDNGFEHDKYNVGNSAPGYERSILKLNDIGCELYLRDDERKGSTNLGVSLY